MRFAILFRIAWRSLARNPLRTLLTMLGIMIGVAAVIAMLAVGRGAKAAVEGSIAGLGTNVILVFPGSRNAMGARSEAGSTSRFTAEDALALRNEATALQYITPQVRTSAQVKSGGQNWRTSVMGVYPDYLLIRQWNIVSGNPLTAADERSASKLCLVGRTVADNLFGIGSDPVGQSLRIKNLPFKIVGLLEAKGQNSFGQDQDDLIIAPFSTVQHKIMGAQYAQSLFASATSESNIPLASQQINEILRRRLKLSLTDSVDFSVRTQTEIAEAATATSRTLTLLLSSIAGISLLVGGIGIMNIMLVSVTERTREIGIRLAVGARGRDILLQFLVEAIVISFMGGVIGVLLGVIASTALSAWQGWAVSLSINSFVISFAFATATGIFFGWYPARKAARMNPIEALRYE